MTVSPVSVIYVENQAYGWLMEIAADAEINTNWVNK
jgi:hypothetical protein